MDVIEVLKEDHEAVSELFRQYRGGSGLTGLVRRVTGSVPARERRLTLQKICSELDTHARLEEEIFYPAVQATGDEKLLRLVDESVNEHAEIKKRVAAISAEPEGDEVDAYVNDLEQCVEHHVEEEEGEMFPHLSTVMPDAERNELGRRFQAGKRESRAIPARARTAKRRRKTAPTRTRARGRTPRTTRTTRARPRKNARAKRARTRHR
jgi:hemerythrin superfamily protein